MHLNRQQFESLVSGNALDIARQYLVKAKIAILEYGCDQVDTVIAGVKQQYNDAIQALIDYDFEAIPDVIETGLDSFIEQQSPALWQRVERGIRSFAERFCTPQGTALAAGQDFVAEAMDDTLPD